MKTCLQRAAQGSTCEIYIRVSTRCLGPQFPSGGSPTMPIMNGKSKRSLRHVDRVCQKTRMRDCNSFRQESPTRLEIARQLLVGENRAHHFNRDAILFVNE